MKTFEAIAVCSATLWLNVKYRRLVPNLRSAYAFNCEDVLPSGWVKRVFYNETRGDGSGFAEYFNTQGALKYIDFFDTTGKNITRVWVDFKVS